MATNNCVPRLAKRRKKRLLLFDGGLLFIIAHLHNIGTHMTLPVECGRRFYLQFTCIEVSGDYAFSAQLEQFFATDIPGDLADDIRLCTRNITFHQPAAAYNDLGRATDVADHRAIDTQIAVAADVAFECSARADQCGATTICFSCWMSVLFLVLNIEY